ncbi:Chromatin assembly factor 1 subunit rlf2, partial [Neolecta irregularis DAH-3]
VRPPFHGTVSLRPPPALFRNPLRKLLPLLYDFDSEAEWLDDDDDPGEDLLSDEEDDVDSVLSEEDQRFLDDDGDTDDPGRRRPILDLAPCIQGPCAEGLITVGVCECLLDCPPPSGIDPFHDYWADNPLEEIPSMPPPDTCLLPSTLKKKLQAFPQDKLVDFIRLIKGSQEPKILLVQVLKKHFPSITKAIIAEKLGKVAKRTGRKESDVWVLTPEMELALSYASGQT